MNPVEFKDQTQVLNKPKDMSNDQCNSLAVKQHIVDLDGSKYNAFDSVWQLSPEERKEVNESGRIRLRVIASGMPPVLLMSEPKEVIELEAFVSDINGALEAGENVFNPNEKFWPESTSVARTKLIPEINVLEVEFVSGKIYHYQNFLSILWPDLVATKSIGQFVNKQIKGQFVEVEVIPE